MYTLHTNTHKTHIHFHQTKILLYNCNTTNKIYINRNYTADTQTHKDEEITISYNFFDLFSINFTKYQNDQAKRKKIAH